MTQRDGGSKQCVTGIDKDAWISFSRGRDARRRRAAADVRSGADRRAVPPPSGYPVRRRLLWHLHVGVRVARSTASAGGGVGASAAHCRGAARVAAAGARYRRLPVGAVRRSGNAAAIRRVASGAEPATAITTGTFEYLLAAARTSVAPAGLSGGAAAQR
eukprot:ctg_5500.g760